MRRGKLPSNSDSACENQAGQWVASALHYRALPVARSKRSMHEAPASMSGRRRARPLHCHCCARAVRNDPTFAAAIYDLGLAYRNSGQEERSRELLSPAFSMRSRASVRKRFNIEPQYYAFVTVDADRAVKSVEARVRSYPRDYSAASMATFADIPRRSRNSSKPVA